MKESGLVRWALKEFRAAGWYAVKTCPPIQSGTPDVLCAVPPDGRFVAVEFKAGLRGILSPLQERRILEVERAGGKGIVCRSRQDVRDLLQLVKSWSE